MRTPPIEFFGMIVYNVIMKTVEESAEMMGIIFSNRIYDPMMFYNFVDMCDALLGWVQTTI